MLSGKNIVVGVCGGIAAYKACDVVSRLKKLNAEVNVIMTKAACEFVSELSFRTLSKNEVVTDMFACPAVWDVRHVSLAKKADLFLIVPATANFIGKTASGIADDMLTTTVMATRAKTLIVPAMNTEMYNNPIVQDNMKKLKSYGYTFLEPDDGLLACGDSGKGRLPEPAAIVEAVLATLHPKKDLEGKKVMVTAGPTREPIDPVRFLSNNSSGKMGIAVAKSAYLRGAEVTLVLGPTLIKPNFRCELVNVVTAEEMYNACMEKASEMDIIIMSAAVSDFSSVDVSSEKIKKTDEKAFSLQLKQNKDILKGLVANKKGNCVIGGFSMETENLLTNSKKKLSEKGIDFIVANNLNTKGAGFMVDTNVITIIDRDGNINEYPLMSKEDAAHKVIDRAVLYMQ